MLEINVALFALDIGLNCEKFVMDEIISYETIGVFIK